MLHRDIDAIRHCGQFIGFCLGLCYGVFTMRNTEIETDNEGIGFYSNVWTYFHCSYSETNVNLHWVLCTFIGICLSLGIGVRQRNFINH